MYGDTPHIVFGQQEDYKILFYSEHMAALTVPVTLAAGYGVVKMGTALAKNLSAGTSGNKDKVVPYNPTTFTGTEEHAGRAYLVADSGTANAILNVTIEDSYKFKVGDDVVINDNTTTAENLGAIISIDRTTYVNYAVITVTTNVGGTSFTTARFAYIAVEAGISANNYSDCVGILMGSKETGTGVHAQGANAEMVISNATLYAGMLTNVDAAAIVDLAAVSIGEFLVIK